MAKRKARKRGRRRNTTTAIARVRAPQTIARKTNPKRRSRRSNPARRRNPLSIGGLRPMELGAAGVAAVLTQAIRNAVPIGPPGSVIQIGYGIGLAFLVNKFWPKGFAREAATIGAATPPVVDLVNMLVPNLGSTISSQLNRLLPAPPASAGTAGLRGLVSVPRDSPLYAG